VNRPALDVKNLSVWLESGSARVPVVDGLSFSIEAGQATGLVGESGCGKTMTARAIMGQLPAPGIGISCDAIEINGRDISRLSARQKRAVLGHEIAMIFQQPATALDPVFTIGHQIGAVYRRHRGGGTRQARQAMLAALNDVGFSQAEDIAAAYPHQLSGGMRQLAMIAMATVCKPAVVIADEPTTALDSGSRALILQQLEQLRTSRQTAILYISHDLSVVRHSCSDVMVMYCGRIMERADCRDLFAHPRHPYSAGLLSCIPRLGKTRPPAISAIPGQVPPATELPGGCHFAPRCTRSVAECRQSVPSLGAGGIGAACFRPL